jgi:hypothetical protein
MRDDRRLLGWLGVLLGSIVMLTGCISNYDAAVAQLSVPEQREYRTYRLVMSAAQTRTYFAKPSAAERTAYLQEIGLLQRFQSLDPLDRDTVQSGFPRVGMDADALRFVWGEPEYTQGDARRSAHWYYLGSSLELGVNGNRYGNSGGNRVDVYLVDGKVVSWVDGPMTDDDKGSDRCDRC